MTIGFRQFQLPHNVGQSGQMMPAASIDAATLPPQNGMYRRFFKRALDVTAVVLSLPVVAPVVGALALMVMLDGGKPFYSQMRVGLHGKRFRMWKLRTMVSDADQRLKDHLEGDAAARKEWDAFQKLQCDPRITPLGNLLRKSSLDELPQLWNVLVGDMSLVGPRPMLPEQTPLYPGRAYFVLRPGVTGLWQVSDRNASTFAQRAEFDASYERALSFVTDVRVLVATIGVVFRCTGK